MSYGTKLVQVSSKRYSLVCIRPEYLREPKISEQTKLRRIPRIDPWAGSVPLYAPIIPHSVKPQWAISYHCYSDDFDLGKE